MAPYAQVLTNRSYHGKENSRIYQTASACRQSQPFAPTAPRVNIMEFCKAFNAKTQAWSPVCRFRVVITAFADKSFTFISACDALIKKAIKLDKGSARPHLDKVGTITRAQLEEIAKAGKSPT